MQKKFSQSFSASLEDMRWLEAEAHRRKVTVSLVLCDAIALYKKEHATTLAEYTKALAEARGMDTSKW